MKLIPFKNAKGKNVVEFLGKEVEIKPGQTSVQIDGVIFPVAEIKAATPIEVTEPAPAEDTKVEVKTTKRKSTKRKK